jgi:LmbE family N-acetylglucosaminyl deacetylase
VSPRRLFSGPLDRRIKRVLCIVAHPDDIEWFCGGTVLMLARRGVAIDFVLATSGDKGTRDTALEVGGSLQCASASRWRLPP